MSIMPDKARNTLSILMVVENCTYPRDLRVSREAKALHSFGHQVTIICPNAGRQRWHESINGIAIYRFPAIEAGTHGWKWYLLEYTYATLAIMLLSLVVLVREGFDVIHVANPPDTLVLTAAIFRLIDKRIIYDQHDLCPELYVAKFNDVRPRLLAALIWLERLSYSVADHVIVTNESYKRVAIERGRISESKVSIVRNGPDLQDISSQACNKTFRDGSRSVIVYSGVIGSQDRLDYLCRILYHLRYELCRSDFRCVVLGDGDALQKTQALSHELRLDDCMRFTGWIDDAATFRSYLASADICVSSEPSNNYNDRSTFIKIMEYMAAGKPIVSFDLPETRVSAQGAAVYVRRNDEAEFAAQLATLMDDPVVRSELGCRGQERIRSGLAWQYSIPHLAGAYQECFRVRDALSRVAEL